MSATRLYVGLTVVGLVVGATGCSGGAGNSTDENVDTQSTAAPIISGSTASSYTEAVLVDMYQNGQIVAACSGALIAPKVVLTAGHCVEGMTGWKITAPYAQGQTAMASSSALYDWTGGSEEVNPNEHDIGLVFLSTAITLTEYPVIAQARVASGGSLINIGRINNGSFSSTNLYASKPVTVTDANGYPFDYEASEIIQSGDSGGPCEVPNTSPHVIAAVNSGAGGGTEVLARTDLLQTWIAEKVASHGGSGGTTPPPPPPPPPPGCAGTGEAEPNDTYTTPNALNASACGQLEASGQDWFSWSVSGAGVDYDLNLATSGNAELQMWKNTGSSWTKIANTSSTRFTKTSSASGDYVAVVWSQTAAAQSYTLSLTK